MSYASYIIDKWSQNLTRQTAVISMTDFLSELASQRPIFHSEADFQHAFDWQLQQWFSDAKIRLEYPALVDKWIYLDIWAEIASQNIAVELKYKTTLFEAKHDGETFKLKNHSAQDVGRYDFIKDIQRLEQLVSSRSNIVGYAIFLSNETLYWSSSRKQTIDADFHLNDERALSGTMHWSEIASAGTTKGRSAPLTLRNDYLTNWQQYSILAGTKGDFRYLAIEVSK
jgi:hypothetical protein